MENAISIINKLYPLSLAETNWDNVGLIVEAAKNENKNEKRIIITNDLTEEVIEECIEKCINFVITYHPVLFKSTRKILGENGPQTERVVAKCLMHGISVYSPHTSLDSAPNGVNDWLCSGILSNGEKFKCVKAISPNKCPFEEFKKDAVIGMGRIVTFEKPITINEIIMRIKDHLMLKTIRYSLAYKHTLCTEIDVVAVCAGSGNSLADLIPEAKLYITGELSHSKIIELISDGITVVMGEHSNTERGFLQQTFKDNLMKHLPGYEIFVSQKDLNPIQYL